MIEYWKEYKSQCTFVEKDILKSISKEIGTQIQTNVYVDFYKTVKCIWKHDRIKITVKNEKVKIPTLKRYSGL